MRFTLDHVNVNVTDLSRSIEFYQKALGLREVKRKKQTDGGFELVFLTDGAGAFCVELTWLRDKQSAYDLGDNETHIAFVADDIEEARSLHGDMGCVCFENPAMGVYFIEDPDGYWLEIIPRRR